MILRAMELKTPESVLLGAFTQCKKLKVPFQLLSQKSQTAWLRDMLEEIKEIS